MSYKVKLDIFEGPFDLLVYLIERSGLSIYDVNISDITDQYMDYVNAIELIHPESAAEFMLLAATLIQIKSKMLLPSAKKEEENTAEDDPRDELARKITEYKKFKKLAECLREKEEEGSRIFSKPREDISEYTDNPVEILNTDMDKFISAFKSFLERRRRIEEVKKRYQRVSMEKMTMEAKTDRVRRKLLEKRCLDFTELIDDADDTYDVVLTFVTLLEMLKAGAVSVEQSDLFGDIDIILKEGAFESAGQEKN